MKVILINSNFPVKEGITHLPLSLAHPAATLLSKGHEVKIIDLAVEKHTKKHLKDIIARFGPGLIVINSETTVLQTRDYCFALKLSKWIKHEFMGIPLAMMGAHVTFRGIETLKRQPQIDLIIRFEADIVLLNLVEALEEKENLTNVKGIIFRNKDDIVQNQAEPPIEDLDGLPFPARKLFPIKKYLEKDDETVVQGSRGCTNRCYFCQSSAMDRCIRYRSMESILEEVKEVLSYGFKSIYFADYDFGAKRERVMEFCSLVKKNKLHFQWACNMRADRISDSAEGFKMLEAIKEAGCYRVFIGFESISSKVLNNINKEVTPSRLEIAAKLLRKHEIGLHASFLFGLPGDDRDTIQSTVEFAKRIKPQIVSFNLLTPFPGTKLGDEPERFGIKITDKLWYEKTIFMKKNIAGNINLDASELQDMANWAYREFLK